ncbi:MAG: prepilin-type N-terminal cleavage/methylation domain-containing protein [Elusimicrobiaceae bacterium]|nr:prepilin-type N-terminal cleavage/methylation domain-containing protein [Elusimicrobiaceae bacterium]
MKQGFTLIELLVVVLIIGILAAIALPQYTKAVEKSRAAEAIQLLGDLATAEQIYFMQAGSYTDQLDQLDIELPGISGSTAATKNFNLYVRSSDGATEFVAAAVRANNGTDVSTGDQKYAVGLGLTSSGQITRWCGETIGSDVTTAPGSFGSATLGSADICKSIAGNSTGQIK